MLPCLKIAAYRRALSISSALGRIGLHQNFLPEFNFILVQRENTQTRDLKEYD
jgi:hypothetical protein